MGFGILFIGYFLLLNNVSYYMLTDVISALLMLMAFYKLAYLNRGFSLGFIFCSIFSLFGAFEFISEAMRMFNFVSLGATFISVVGMIRYLLICLSTVFMLIGARDIAREVDLNALALRCHRGIILTFIIYALNIIWQTSSLLGFAPNVKFMALSGYIIILATLILVIMNLVSVYGCYMHICMPSDNAKGEKKSRFSFVNAFRAHEEEKRREYTEYKLDKLNAKLEKLKNKDKKK